MEVHIFQPFFKKKKIWGVRPQRVAPPLSVSSLCINEISFCVGFVKESGRSKRIEMETTEVHPGRPDHTHASRRPVLSLILFLLFSLSLSLSLSPSFDVSFSLWLSLCFDVSPSSFCLSMYQQP